MWRTFRSPSQVQGEAQVKVKAASINPGEAKIREGLLHARGRRPFPRAKGADLAGIVTKTGPGVQEVKVGDEVDWISPTSAQATRNMRSWRRRTSRRSPRISPGKSPDRWPSPEVRPMPLCGRSRSKPATRLPCRARRAASGRSPCSSPGDAGANVIGIASLANHDWLWAHGVEAVAYAEGLAERLRERSIDAFIDCHGDGYVKLAIELGVPRERIDTIIDFAAAQQYGVKAEGSAAAKNARDSGRARRSSSLRASWTCRSPRPSRSARSAPRSGSSSRATRGERSSSRRERRRACQRARFPSRARRLDRGLRRARRVRARL